jgi:glucose-6-phosphate 1-dehydrogenase
VGSRGFLVFGGTGDLALRKLFAAFRRQVGPADQRASVIGPRAVEGRVRTRADLPATA